MGDHIPKQLTPPLCEIDEKDVARLCKRLEEFARQVAQKPYFLVLRNGLHVYNHNHEIGGKNISSL